MKIELRDVRRHPDRLSFEVWVDGKMDGYGDLWDKDDLLGGSGDWVEGWNGDQVYLCVLDIATDLRTHMDSDKI